MHWQYKKSIQQNLFCSLSTQDFFLQGCDDSFRSEDYCFACGSNRKHHVSSGVSLLLRNLLPLSDVLMKSPEVPTYVSFCSDVSIMRYQMLTHAMYVQHIEKYIYCDNLLQKFQPLMQFGPHISFCHF